MVVVVEGIRISFIFVSFVVGLIVGIASLERN